MIAAFRGLANQHHRRPRWLGRLIGMRALVVIAILCVQAVCAAQQSTESTGDRSLPDLPRLPAFMPDGRPLRAIGFFQSQVAEVIPQNFEPVELAEFRAAIERLANRTTDNQTSRLKSAEYWVDVDGDELISQRSVLDIESYRQGILRRSLGRVNLALARTGSPRSMNFPYLVSAPDGSLEAVVDGRSLVNHSIEFGWRLKGRVSGSGHEFSMRLPATPQTRIVFSVPVDLSITAIDGVLRRLTSPPPDADGFRVDRDWYEMDAGGLETVRIRTQQVDPKSEGSSFVVRQSTVQYRAAPSGLLWTCRMVVQPPTNRPFPKIVIRDTTITSAKVNSTEVTVSGEVIGDRQQHLELDIPRGIIDPQSPLVDVTLTGHTTWKNRRGWCDLPMPIWVGPQIAYASASDEVELVISDPLQMVAWKLPTDWEESTQYNSDGLVSIYRATGPPIALAETVNSDGQRLLTSQPNWSRVRFSEYPAVSDGETLMRIEESNKALSIQSRVSLTVDPQRVQPLRLIFQPGWSVDALTFVHSGRLIEAAEMDNSTRYLDLWPEAEDVAGDNLQIDIVGSRMIPATSSAAIPATWFARIEGVRSRLTAAILQPADFNWSGQSTLQRMTEPPTDLTSEQLEFFAGTDDQTIWYKPVVAQTPRVGLQTPTVAFNTSTVFQVFRDADEITETVVIEVGSQSQSIRELAIDTGFSGDRPPLRWFISGINDAPATSIASSDIEIGEGETDGIYTIDLSDQVIRGRRLIGRRRYPFPASLRLPLPGVPGAASQQSEVHIGPGLEIQRKSPAAQRIPFGKLAAARFQEVSADSGITDLGRVSRLRYDAVEQPELTIAKSPMEKEITIVWQEQIRIIASSRGSDLIEAVYTVSPASDFVISYDPELQLSSVIRDGKPVDLITLPQRPIVLQSNGKTETIRVRWTRSQFESNWLRACRVPRIEASGTILRSECELVAATDTFAPAALFRGKPNPSQRTTVLAQAGDSVTLVRRNIALAFGWLVAFLVFAIGWRIADHSPMRVAVVVTLLATVMFLWWPWRLAIIGWLIVPLVAAAILSTTQRLAKESSRRKPPPRDGSSVSLTSDADQADFSLGSMARFMIWLLIFGGTAAVVGQESTMDGTSETERRAVIDVLVPLTEEGKVYGDFVYISNRVKDELFPDITTVPIQEPRIQWASYLLKLDSEVTGTDPASGCSLEAEFMVHVDPSELNRVPVRLPMPPNAVRLIERVDESGGLVAFRTAPDGQIVTTLPSGTETRLRVVLKPAVSQAEKWTKLFLPVPPVAATRLTVESAVDMDAMRFGGSTGHLLLETDLRKWVDELGPVNSLEIDFRPEVSVTQDAIPLERRYWVSANAKQVAIDCEVDPPTTMAAGEEFQFVIRDARTPTVVSIDWKLESSELYASNRRLMTFTSVRDNPGPVRLVWIMPVEMPDDRELVSVRIPEVIAPALGENAPAWIALHADPSVRFLPPNSDRNEPLSVDHFLAAWTGYRGDIERATVALDELPTLQLEQRVTTKTKIEQQHDIRFTQFRAEHYFTATISPGDRSSERLSIRYPRSLQLIEATIDGRPINATPLFSGKAKELPLGRFRGSEEVTVQLVAIGGRTNAAGQSQTSPSSIRLVSNQSIDSDCLCTLYRSSSIDLEVTETVETAFLPAPELNPELLIKDWIPVSRWSQTSDSKSVAEFTEDVLVSTRPNVSRFDCSQLISLDQTDNQWTMEVTIGFFSTPNLRVSSSTASGRIPDFVDVEIPSAWCNDLVIEPASLVYAQRVGTDESRQILRIHCDPDADSSMISLRSRFQSNETGLVSVPAVRVLGPGDRRVYINVPNRLDNESVQWRTSAVEAIELPEVWDASDSDRSTYVVASPTWSIDLAPVSQEESSAVAFSSDAQLFHRDDGTLLLCHWDFFPGGLETLSVRLPRDSQVIAAWSAGRAVTPSIATMDDSDKRRLEIPLTMSGLSQPIELLLRLSPTQTRTSDYLPDLINVSSTRNWLVQYAPSRQLAGSAPEIGDEDQTRALALARSVLESVSAVGRTAQRPKDEVAAWVAVWVQRYQMIAQSVGRAVDLGDVSERLGDPRDASVGTVVAQQSLPIHLQWKALDRELADILNRLLPSDSDSSLADPSKLVGASMYDANLFRPGGFSGFTPQQVLALSATNRPRPIKSVSESDLGLRTLIVNLLTLLLVSGLLVCFRSFSASMIPVVVHPAFWLALLGIFGFAVAPLAVAGAMVLVAVTLPAFPSAR